MVWDPKVADTDGYICPPCPVFYPTTEEFEHPLKYISSIRHIGMQAGICKIVPPEGWRPPFAINEKTFRFRTRVQQLNCIEGHSRAEGQFVEALRLFLYRRGEPMKELPRADGQLVNLHLLYKTVASLGGFDAVCASDRWGQVVRRVGRTKAASEPSEALCQTYKAHYLTTMLAYEKQQREEGSSDSTRVTTEAKAKREEAQATPAGTGPAPAADTRATPSSKPRSLSGKKRPVSTDGDGADDEKRVKRTLFSEGEQTSSEESEGHPAAPAKLEKRRKDSKRALRQRDLEPEALKPSDSRRVRLGPPEIVAGQKFYRFFPESGAVLAEVKRVFGGKKPHVAVRYLEDGSNDDVEMATMEILIANGWNAEASELAYNSEICQICLRGDCSDRMLLCDGCNSGQHLFCLDKPLAAVPQGDWYCSECVQDALDPGKRHSSLKFGFDMGAEISMKDYKERADAWKRKYFSLPEHADPDAEISDRALESEYWRLLGIPSHEQRWEVQYGSDVDTGANGGGFPRLDLLAKNVRTVNKRWRNLTGKAKSDYVRQLSEFFSHGLRGGLSASCGGDNTSPDAAPSLEDLMLRYAQDDWNLNNLPTLPGSVLQHLDEDIKGIMIPWLYAGMCFSTFCWHVEDHNFYSTSYLHCGAPKTWYGIPSASAEHFERTMKQLTPELFGSQPDLHMQLVTMFSPKTLRAHGVPVYRATHRPNEFVVTFPSAYHAGFNNGFNCAEAVNFATVDWLPWGAKALHKYREFRKLPVFCHEALVCTLAETLVDGSGFDVELTRSSLLPAVEQLLRHYREFQRRVEDGAGGVHVQQRQLMAEFDTHQHRGGVGGAVDPEKASTSSRRSMVARACNKPRSAEGSKPTRGKTKMKTAPTMRPTRMVLWAGRSGKDEGLRCVTCKQYCYLQAVVCTKCRPPHGSGGGATAGCVEHYPTMCKCRKPDNLVYLYRYEASRLEGMVAALRSRLDGANAWNLAWAAAVQPPSDQLATKPTIQGVKDLLSRGRSCGGADRSRLEALEDAIAAAEQWSVRAERLVRLLEKEPTQGECLSLDAFESLLADGEKLLAAPAALEKLGQVVVDWRADRDAATRMLDSVQGIQREEAVDEPKHGPAATPPLAPALELANALHGSNARFRQLSASLTGVSDRLRLRKESDMDGSLLSRLADAQRYLDVLCEVNAVSAAVAARAEGSAAPTQTQVERVLREAEGLGVGASHGIAKAKELRKLMGTTESTAQEVDQALRDRSKSSEELEVLLRRTTALPIPPSNAQELQDRLDKCRLWESRAQHVLDASTRPLTNRPSLDEVEAFYAQADAHFVSASSLLRRQVHSRLQDCRRWHDAVHALFLRPSTSHLALAPFLQAALERTQQGAPPSDQGWRLHSHVHCVCRQVLSERAEVVACQRCQHYFHPQCVPELLPRRPRDAFLCPSCRPPPRKRTRDRDGSRPSLFCVCRGVEQAPMICCDFCDEWYHAACVELSPLELDRIDAFRCPRCSRGQHLYYLDKKLLRRECQSRRPALARVESLLAQVQTQLVAWPPGARELEAYVHAVKEVQRDVDAFVHSFALREFSPAAFDTPGYACTQEDAVVQLMERVTDLEVGLEATQAQLGAVHWCVRACYLVLGQKDRAPRYAHLAALLQDVKDQEPGFAFPREEYRLMQLTIAERVSKAGGWLRATKTLEVEEWNVEKARRLLREAQELGAYLELPATELQLVQRIVTSREEHVEEEEPDSPSAIAWKKTRGQ